MQINLLELFLENLDYLDETLLITSGFKYGLTFATLWKKGNDGRDYCCTLPEMHWSYVSEKGLTLPATESRLMSRDKFEELFE